MSQVIVTNDELKNRRDSTRLQEGQIDTAAISKKWQLNNIARHDVGARKIVLLVISPILAFWALLMVGLSFSIGLFSVIMRVLGKLIPR